MHKATELLGKSRTESDSKVHVFNHSDNSEYTRPWSVWKELLRRKILVTSTDYVQSCHWLLIKRFKQFLSKGQSNWSNTNTQTGA